MFRSGLKILDEATNGGIQPGSIVEIYGEPDCGKTALALWYCKQYLSNTENLAGWLLSEQPSAISQFKWASIDPSSVIVKSPSVQNPLDIAGFLVEEGVNLVVIDGIASIVNKDMEEVDKILSASLPSLKEKIKATNSLLVLCNQSRTVLGSNQIKPASSCAPLLKLVDYRIKLTPGATLISKAKGVVDSSVGMRVRFDIYRMNNKAVSISGKFNLLWAGGLRDIRDLKV